MYSAALYSKADLVFNGTGTLNVNAGYRNGIKSNDGIQAENILLVSGGMQGGAGGMAPGGRR